MVTLDGFMAGPNEDLDWHVWDEEMEKYAHDLLDSVDTLIFGRVTYQLMADYWPSATDSIAPKMNQIPKLVFSRTLEKVEWQNSRLAKNDVSEEISKLKQQPGKDLVIFGSASLASSFINLGLVDEYQMIVNPVILASGKPLFKNIRGKLSLKLFETKPFRCGNVILYYQPA